MKKCFYLRTEKSEIWTTSFSQCSKDWEANCKFVSQCRKFCGQSFTNLSPSVEVIVKWFSEMHHSAKIFEILIKRFSNSVEKLEKRSEILYTVPKTLRCDLQFCLKKQNSLSGDLPFCTTKPESLRENL